MQKIAKKVGFSETAFVHNSDKADFKVKFFTTNAEVNLCGHATIATFFLMKKLNLIKVWKYKQETKAWILDIEIKDVVIPIKNLEDLNAIKPDLNKIAKISKKYDIIWYHLFTLETKFNSTAHCRNFWPL